MAKNPISFLGGVDQDTGRIVEKDHDLEGKRAQVKLEDENIQDRGRISLQHL